jgi:hypothetical protein
LQHKGRVMSGSFVFISYAQADGREFAERLYQSLQEHGIPVWRDQRNLNPYQDFSTMIENAIKQASHIIVLLSPSIVDDEDSFVRREILYAQGCQKPIIPVVLPGFPAGKVPTLINHLTWIRFQDYDEGLHTLLARLRQPVTGYEHGLDPLREHVEQLHEYALEELRRTVFKSHVLPLRVLDTPASVMSARPLAYQSRRPGWFEDAVTQREFENFAVAFNYYEGRMLLLGEPGAGKTTTLLAFALEKAKERLVNSEALLPVYAPIYTWDGTASLVTWLASVTNLDPAQLQAAIETGQALLLLDGLDELATPGLAVDQAAMHDPRPAFIEALNQVATTPTLVTCRFREYQEITRQSAAKISLKGAVMLKPLNVMQIEDYLQPQPELWDTLQNDPQLLDLARTPLILTLLMVAYQDAGEQALEHLEGRPSGLRDQIFKTFVHKRYEFEQTWASRPLPYTLDKIYDILGQIALTSLLWGNENEFGISIFHHVVGDHPEDFIELARCLHLIHTVREGVYRFIHSLLRDHFAFPYCLLCLKDPNAAVRHGAALALAKIADSRAVEPLILALCDESKGMRKLAALGLGQIGDIRAVSALTIALRDPNSWVRSEAALALGKIGDATALESLVLALRDENKYVRQNAATALGQIGDTRVVEPLIGALADTHDWVRRHATEALAQLGSPAIDLLMGALKDRNPFVRRGAAMALGEIGDQRAIEALVQSLHDDEESVKTSAAWALEQLGDPRGVDSLNTALGNLAGWIQRYVPDALKIDD